VTETTAELKALTSDDLLLVIIRRLDNVNKRLQKIEHIGDLVEQALKAVTMESQNSAAITQLEHRVALLEGRKPRR